VGLKKRTGWFSIKFPTLRFRAKIMLGFAVTLAISAASMGCAYLGFEHVSSGVAAYRLSVTEADISRNIDRELISYRSLARYFVVTGKEEDSKAALVAEASLKEAIIAAMKGTANPARLDQVTKLEREFRAFTKIFAEIVKLKEESALIAKNQLARSGTAMRFKLCRAMPTTHNSRRSSSGRDEWLINFRRCPGSSAPSLSTPIRRSPPAHWHA
jgi:CHASE3 domain sensor protein